MTKRMTAAANSYSDRGGLRVIRAICGFQFGLIGLLAAAGDAFAHPGHLNTGLAHHVISLQATDHRLSAILEASFKSQRLLDVAALGVVTCVLCCLLSMLRRKADG